MFLRTTSRLCLGMAFAFAVINCASKPPQYETISSSNDPSTEITQTDQMLHEGRQSQLDILAPKNFAEAEKAEENAKKLRSEGKSNDKILEQVAYARGWLKEAQSKGDVARVSMSSLTEARSGAWKAGAEKNYPTEWQKLEKDTKKVTSAIEKDKLPSDKESKELIQRYRDLQIKTIETTSLSKAQGNLKTASDEGAAKLAPKTYGVAQAKYKKADDLIKANPNDTAAITEASTEATVASERLVSVTGKVKGASGSTEDLVLKDERQEDTIVDLQNTNEATSGALATTAGALAMQERQAAMLQKKAAVDEKAALIRRELNPREAEVVTEGSKIKVHLKGLQFATNKAVIPAKETPILDRLNVAIKNSHLGDAKFSVEGHTDSVGPQEVNQALSEKRAQAVQDYMVAKGDIPRDNIDAKGVSYTQPSADNKTATSRAQNRTIDVVIDTDTAATSAQ